MIEENVEAQLLPSTPSLLQSLYNIMSVFDLVDNCTENCSGHGECHNGTCLCEVQFDGATCREPNWQYHIAFATIFYIICLISIIQLVCCIQAEFFRMKAPSLWRACRLTTQKALYFLTFLAGALKGAYFSSLADADFSWGPGLLSAYYPVLLTGSSLIVCFWAEVFHLENIRWERPRFLSKSFLGFLVFNIITYTIWIANLLVTYKSNSSTDERNFYNLLFTGCYAFLLLIVVIFFLIYGVEVFFKVRGGFLQDHFSVATRERTAADPAAEGLINHKDDSRQKPSSSGKNSGEEVQMELLEEPQSSKGKRDSTRRGTPMPRQTVDVNQLNQSRLGLVSQAVMLLVTVVFLLSDVLGPFWKDKVALVSRNCLDVIFRLFDVGAALWFPCVLWNCIRPEQLWILNPKKILRRLEIEKVGEPERDEACEGETWGECYICYDAERKDAGPLIQPCLCRGDVAAVHHECLRRWLIESSENTDIPRCAVCNVAYQLERSTSWSGAVAFLGGNGWTSMRVLQVFVLVTVMGSSAILAWYINQNYHSTESKLLSVSFALLIQLVGLKFLGVNFVKAYQRAKVSAVKIISVATHGSRAGNAHLNTISGTVHLDLRQTGVPPSLDDPVT